MRILTAARDLKRRKAREKSGLFVAEGVRAVEELAKSPIDIRGVLVGDQVEPDSRAGALIESLAARGITVERVKVNEFASAAETESPQGVLALASIPQRSVAELFASPNARLVVLDAVQDPGNVGTILRTAAALRASGVVAMPGTVDLWNAKVVRSAMGALFSLPTASATWVEVDAARAETRVALWGADAGGASVRDLDVPESLAIMVGNEGAGLTPDARSRADRIVALPIASTVESLNVAVATGILLYEVSRA